MQYIQKYNSVCDESNSITQPYEVNVTNEYMVMQKWSLHFYDTQKCASSTSQLTTIKKNIHNTFLWYP